MGNATMARLTPAPAGRRARLTEQDGSLPPSLVQLRRTRRRVCNDDLQTCVQLPRRNAPGALMNLSAQEGVGNAGCPVHPQPRVRWGSEKMHTSLSGRTGNHPASPHAMVLTASFVISPAIGFFATVACSVLTANLTPASRRQDHTTSPSASGALVSSTISVHRIQPRAIAIRPSSGVDGGTRTLICMK
jgi:hypothetical protein